VAGKENIMKKLIALLLTGTLLLGSASLAQTKVEATFYDGIPSDTGSIVTDDFGQSVTATLVSQSIGEKIYNLEDADYVSLNVANNNFVFEIYGGDTTNEMTLVADTNDGATISLGEVTNAFDGAANTDLQLALFSDEDGVVQGFYTFTSSNIPNVVTTDAVTLTLVNSAGATTYQVVDSGTIALENVQVLQGEAYVSLYHVANLTGDAAQLL
jgi:hypothetical protein